MATYVKDPGINSNDLTLTERHKYGSSLLGINRKTQNVDSYTWEEVISFERGNDRYILLTDHLGNTRAEITDKKIQQSVGMVTVDSYIADQVSAYYYSAYGAISERSAPVPVNAFNGQRMSLELGEFAQTAQFWEYNGDVGRRWNMDSKPNTSISPYNCFAGNPIAYADPSGDTTINGEKYEAGNEAAATYLQDVTVVGHKRTPNIPSAQPTSQVPYGEINEVILDRAVERSERFEKIHAEDYTKVKTGKGYEIKMSKRRIDMVISGASDGGAELKASLAKSLTKRLQVGFAYLDFADVMNLGVTFGNGGGTANTDLPIPLIGGVTGMLINNQVAEFDKIALEAAFKQGYAGAYSILTNPNNASVGTRSGFRYIWASDDALGTILQNGIIDFSKLRAGCDYVESSPHAFPSDITEKQFSYFLVFHKSDKSAKSGGVVKRFGVFSVPKRKN